MQEISNAPWLNTGNQNEPGISRDEYIDLIK